MEKSEKKWVRIELKVKKMMRSNKRKLWPRNKIYSMRLERERGREDIIPGQIGS